MKRVLLVPHGQTPWNAAGRFQGHTDIGMNPHGIEQAERLAQTMRGERIASILSSDLKRAHETATIIAAQFGMPVRTDARLRELHFGTWEGLTGPEVAAHDPAGWERWDKGKAADFPGGETLEALRDRLRVVLTEVVGSPPSPAGEPSNLPLRVDDEAASLIVAHRGALRVMICVALGLEPMWFRQFYLDQTSVSELWFTPHETILYRLNDAHHLRGMTHAG